MIHFFKKTASPSEDLRVPETEVGTPKAGYVLLVFMIIAALLFGWRAIDDLQNVPERPQSLSSCANEFIPYAWEDYGRYTNSPSAPSSAVYDDMYGPMTAVKGREECHFSQWEVTHGVPALYDARRAQQLDLSQTSLDLEKTNASVHDLEQQYNLGLEETLAQEQQKIYAVPDLQKRLASLRKTQADLQIRADALKADIASSGTRLEDAYGGLIGDYRSAWRWYEFKVFLLEALFVVPFFWVVFYGYRRMLYRKSPYTIIMTALLGVASVFLLRIFIAWFWNLFLASILQTVWLYVQNIALLRSVLFYAGMVLSIAVFGGAVYLLQKHVYDPKRSAIRALKHNRCPHCECSLDVAADYCPNCGRRIRETCAQCGNARFVDFPSCPHCGKPK